MEAEVARSGRAAFWLRACAEAIGRKLDFQDPDRVLFRRMRVLWNSMGFWYILCRKLAGLLREFFPSPGKGFFRIDREAWGRAPSHRIS